MQYTNLLMEDQRLMDTLATKGVIEHPIEGMVSNAPLIIKDNDNRSILARYLNGSIIKLNTEPVYDFTPKNKEQAYIWDAGWNRGQLATIVMGGAATGKTFAAIAFALHYVLETKDFKGITLVKPNVSMGKSLGSLPGTLEEKMDPILQSYYDHIRKIVNSKTIISDLKRLGKLEFLPLEYARGRTLEKRVIIFDEMQNTDTHEMMTLLSRCCDSCKVFVLGDPMQVDKEALRASQSGLEVAYNSLLNEEWLGAIIMDNKKNLRGKLSKAVLEKFPANKPKER